MTTPSVTPASFVAGTMLALLAGCSPEPPVIVAVKHCQDVRVVGDVDLVLEQGPVQQLSVPVADQHAVQVEQDADANRLVLSGQSTDSVILNCDCLEALNLRGNSDVAISGNLACPLEQVYVYGSSRLAGADMVFDELELRAAADAQVALNDIDAENIRLYAVGRAQVALAGQAARFEVQASAASAVAASDLISQTVTVDAAGTSRVAVHATAHLSVARKEGADIAQSGTAPMEQKAE